MLSSNARTLLRALSPGPSTPARFVHASSSIHAQRSVTQPKTSRQQLTPASELSNPRGRSQSRHRDSRPSGPGRPEFVRDDMPHPDKVIETRPQRRVSGRELADSDARFFSPQGRRRTPRYARNEDNVDSSAFESPRRSGRESRYDGRDGDAHSSYQARQPRDSWQEQGERYDRSPTQTSRDKLPWSQTRDLQDKSYAERQAKRESQAGFNKEDSTPRKAKIHNPLEDEFDRSSENASLANLPVTFESPPLLPGLQQCLKELVGDEARPTAIQALAIKHLIKHTPTSESGYRQALLASETGSGKSIAYLLPLLQGLKTTESSTSSPGGSQRVYPQGSPRALVLAPTHELTRQLTGFAKKLSHIAKARIVCASRANEASTGGTRGGTAGDFAKLADAMTQSEDGLGQELVLTPEMGGKRGVDVLMGTPNKLLELTRGHGWNKADEKAEEGRRWVVRAPEVGLERVEWVIVDEADVLLDPDFQENTNKLLADISAARGHPINPPAKATDDKADTEEAETIPHDYPFNLLLTSATIPYSLSSYLDKHHPGIMRLVSPRIHKLPSTLKTEHVSYGQSGGNRLADVERRLRAVWATDVAEGREQGRVVLFVNKGTKVDEVRAWLDSKGVKCVGFNGKSDSRAYGSNRHLDGFLKPLSAQGQEAGQAGKARTTAQNEDEPRVLVTTSLLSRGLDFDSSVRHVFILDSPRNMVDFLHRAGRSARAGQEGTVVLFGKTKGRGSQEGRDVRKRVKAFKA